MHATSTNLLTADELASLLRVNRSHVYALGRERRIPGVIRIGRYMRFERDAVLEYLRQGGDLGQRNTTSTSA